MTVDGIRSADEIALEWFVVLRDDEVTDGQRRAYAAWRAADPEHERACAELERIWGALDALAPNANTVIAPDITGSTIVSLATSERPGKPTTLRSRHLALAASLLLAVAVGWQSLPIGLWSDYRTSIGEHKLVTLDDGSEVELGGASALDVTYTAQERKVTLIAGEAFFTVAKDPARPFVVRAAGGEVLVRGTAFNVKIGTDVSVAVTHNTVEVKAADHAPVRVIQGQGVHYDARMVSPVAAVDLDAVQAWRQGQLVFHDARLADVLAELQRYRHGYIQLLGSDLADRRVTAVFDATRPDAALNTMAESLDLRLYRATDLLIAIASN